MPQQSFGVFQGYTKNSHYGIDVFFAENNDSLSLQAVYHFQFYFGPAPNLGSIRISSNYSVEKMEITSQEESSTISRIQEAKDLEKFRRYDLEGKLKLMTQDKTRDWKKHSELDFRNYLRQFEMKR